MIRKPALYTFSLLALYSAISPAFAVGPNLANGAVYAMTNALDDNVIGNEIVVYDRAADGMLSLAGRYATGGVGGDADDPVDALGSQFPLILSDDRNWLLAVNAGSDDITVFRVMPHGLEMTDIVDSGGDFPVSLAMDGDLLYVLNAGGHANITGFTLQDDGTLVPLPGSTLELGVFNDPPVFVRTPAQVGFSPDGSMLLVTVKQQQRIDVFAIGDDGLPSAIQVNPAGGEDPNSVTLPFGFSFDRRGHLLVAEPFGALPDSSIIPQMGPLGAVSSYELADDGSLTTISDSVPNIQATPCWVIVSPNGHFAYTTNNGSSTISAYGIDNDGSLYLIDSEAAETISRPVDLGMTTNGHFLYSVNAFTGTIGMFEVDKLSGQLTSMGEIKGLPEDAGAVGIAVR